MDGLRRHNTDSYAVVDYTADGSLWWFPATDTQAPPENHHQQKNPFVDRNHPSMENNCSDNYSILLNPYSTAPPVYQNPNSQNYQLVHHHQPQYPAAISQQNPITAQNNQLMDDIYYPLYSCERSMYATPNPSMDYPYERSIYANPNPSLDYLYVNHLQSSTLPVPVTCPLPKPEIMGLQQLLDRLRVDDHRRNSGTTRNGGYGFMYDHQLGSSSSSSLINGSRVLSIRNHHHSRFSYFSIKEMRGRIHSVARNEQGCRFLQNKLDERNPIDVEIILSEVRGYLSELMRHQSGNYLVQKLIGVLNEHQLTKLILSIVTSEERLFMICGDLTGSRVMQKLLDSSEYPMRQPLTREHKSLLVSALKNITAPLCKSTHGYHVIKRCLQKFSHEYTKEIMEEISANFLNLAMDKSGCCLLQDCMLFANDEQREQIIAHVVANALYLAEHSFGNYVVQYVLGLKIPHVTADVLAELAGNYFALAQGKCSSNVVEKCLVDSGEEQSTGIINELIHHPDILELMHHPFGNYVVQTAWTVSQGRRIRQTLYALVQMNSQSLRSHLFGKMVLAKVRGSKNLFY